MVLMFPSFKFRLARILVSLIPFWSKRKTVSKAQGRLLIEDPAPPVFFRLKRGLLRPNHGFMDPDSLLQQARRKLSEEPSAADLSRFRLTRLATWRSTVILFLRTASSCKSNFLYGDTFSVILV